ncbi:MAG: PAS domain S-box protein [Caldithrix sp.]|nr:PAS domain S-box protein [Caldithrix sp.]
MNVLDRFKKIPGTPRNMILIFLSLALIMIVSALLELYQSKRELYQVMENDAHSLLNTLLIASGNALDTYGYLDDFSRKALLEKAVMLKHFYQKNDAFGKRLAQDEMYDGIAQVRIYDQQGKLLYDRGIEKPESYDPRPKLMPIFDGYQDTLIIGFRKHPRTDVLFFEVALALKDNGALLLSGKAEALQKIRKDIGFGSLLRRLVNKNQHIVFASLQDTANILAASGNVRVLEAIQQSKFLMQSLQDSLFRTRTTQFDTLNIFEAVHPFNYKGRTIGLFRLGISMELVQTINERIIRRLVIISIILIAFGSIIISFIFTREKFQLLQKQFEVIETYSGKILENVSDAIIVFDTREGIKVFNKAAEQLFKVEHGAAIGKDVVPLFTELDCIGLLEDGSNIKQIQCRISGSQRFLLASKNNFNDEEGITNTIIVIRDMTEQKHLEEQIERKQRLSAMGELASGVAHEIRNPLNTIGTIIQQLDKDFEPQMHSNEYHELAQLVSKEVQRINHTVQDFLSFARPAPVRPTSFKLIQFFNTLEKQYLSTFQEKNITFEIHAQWDGKVQWDEEQMRQVFLNLIENSVHAIGSSGSIIINVDSISQDEIEIQIRDDGMGMEEQVKNSIFNLYFTTKNTGTGIGLSMVQRIIYEHRGVINVESELNKGTVFTMRLPITV